MESNRQKDTTNRPSLDRRDILAAGLVPILIIDLIFTISFIFGFYPINDYEGKFSIAYITWFVFCIGSFFYSVFWGYITLPINRWAMLALIFSTITLVILAFATFVPPGATLLFSFS